MTETPSSPDQPAERFVLERESIRLGDLLKVALGMSGGEAKQWIQGEQIRVDGVVETRRGRQLRGGERVEVGEAGDEAPAIEVVAREAGERSAP